MGRSRSCFQIITCGGNSKDAGEIDVLESSDSRDKRWSFRKRSSQHRVLNNTVITETPPVEKENLETAAIDFQSSANSTVSEKPAVIHLDNEEIHVPSVENPKGSDNLDAASAKESKVDSQVEESVVIVIQAGIRGLLAQRELLKIKNVIKVQAAVRGFLVRRHAVGTLRCAQAIVKVQTIVRARSAHFSPEGSSPDELQKKNEKENTGSKIVVKGEMTKPNLRYTSIQKLLSNNFARQLLESAPRKKPINIKCDPSKNDSAWKWLERWMSVSSLDVLEPQKAESTEQMEREIEGSRVEDRIDSKAVSEADDLNSSTIKSVLPSESENLITYDDDTLQFQTCHSPSLSVEGNIEQPQPENAGTSEAKETSTKVGSVQDQKIQLDDADMQKESNSLSEKPQMDMEQVNPLKSLAPEQLENDGKKSVFGSRKVSSPSFITAQAKFEQLSSAPVSTGTTSSMHQHDGIEPHSETVSSTADTLPRAKEPSADENIVLPGSRTIQVGGSECSTELSISSTLDSPDRSEAGLSDPQAKDVSKKGVENPSGDLSTEVVVKGSSTSPVQQNDFQLLADQPEDASESNGPSKLDRLEEAIESNGQAITSVSVVDSAPSESKLERSSSDQQREQEVDAGNQAYRSSPEASPRSHLTVPESQGTPSSQVSIKAKREKADKTGSYQKQKSFSSGKKSPSSLNRNSGIRSSTENLYKDEKSVKRRNSFEAARPDNVEKELKESSSSNSLPHFMQATESARAKVQSTNSPRSSPDVQDRGLYIKKRHSLPADGRQGSPRAQQPTPKAQQGAKGHEKMWRR